jgi:hypothetical protein
MRVGNNNVNKIIGGRCSNGRLALKGIEQDEAGKGADIVGG